MTMIGFDKKHGAFNFYFDNASVMDLVERLHLEEDGVLTGKVVKYDNEMQSYKISIKLHDENDYVYFNRRELVFWLSTETLDYAFYKMKEYLRSGDFIPSEFCDFVVVDEGMNPKRGGRVKIAVFFHAVS
ncbi:hypothetical protein [Klebsiella aerogenes]|uniref:hypothetical protein n=2 Tax=Klebsiella aerogenes TaxID=548 RepID=UPI0022774A2A|nr:hypothetical protein [Klebsiella aerogenes]MCY4764678.1 hypothetical protein [Klebsiella aerogenes]